jgi:hypothetical protein
MRSMVEGAAPRTVRFSSPSSPAPPPSVACGATFPRFTGEGIPTEDLVHW